MSVTEIVVVNCRRDYGFLNGHIATTTAKGRVDFTNMGKGSFHTSEVAKASFFGALEHSVCEDASREWHFCSDGGRSFVDLM